MTRFREKVRVDSLFRDFFRPLRDTLRLDGRRVPEELRLRTSERLVEGRFDANRGPVITEALRSVLKGRVSQSIKAPEVLRGGEGVMTQEGIAVLMRLGRGIDGSKNPPDSGKMTDDMVHAELQRMWQQSFTPRFSTANECRERLSTAGRGSGNAEIYPDRGRRFRRSRSELGTVVESLAHTLIPALSSLERTLALAENPLQHHIDNALRSLNNPSSREGREELIELFPLLYQIEMNFFGKEREQYPRFISIIGSSKGDRSKRRLFIPRFRAQLAGLGRTYDSIGEARKALRNKSFFPAATMDDVRDAHTYWNKAFNHLKEAVRVLEKKMAGNSKVGELKKIERDMDRLPRNTRDVKKIIDNAVRAHAAIRHYLNEHRTEMHGHVLERERENPYLKITGNIPESLEIPADVKHLILAERALEQVGYDNKLLYEYRNYSLLARDQIERALSRFNEIKGEELVEHSEVITSIRESLEKAKGELDRALNNPIEDLDIYRDAVTKAKRIMDGAYGEYEGTIIKPNRSHRYSAELADETDAVVYETIMGLPYSPFSSAVSALHTAEFMNFLY